MKSKDVKPNATYGEIRKNPDEPMAWEKYRSDEYWDYRKKWEEIPKQGITPEFPLCLDIETTNICNLDCIMCPRTVLIARGVYSDIGLMDFDLYRKILDEGAKYNLPSVKLQYLGEPLAHPDVGKQIKYAKDAGVLDVMFNTNGTLLTKEKSHEILEAGIDAIFFSFDSMDPETYNKIRVGADFQKVIDNILGFLEIKKKFGYENVHTRASMTIMGQDIEDLEKFKEFWLDHVDIAGFGLYKDTPEDESMDSPYNPDFQCAQPFQRMFIMWDGTATPCCVDHNREYIMGDASKQTIYDIWHGPEAKLLRKAQLNGCYNDIGICNKCYFPFTELDGQVVSIDSVHDEVNEIAKKERTRWITDDLELSDKAQKRFDKVNK
tara:strand:+ start:1642 stop:2775 length:1134 start_codon:yes stop_codon:yes gene_type:complete